MKNLFARFSDDQSGATAIEYALIAAFVAIGIVGALKALATTLNGDFSNVTTILSSAK